MPEPNKSSKFAIVTGASVSSIGFLAAKTLAGQEHGFCVILACRDPAKGHESEAKIREAHASDKNYQCRVQFLPLDLASRESIVSFVESLKQLENYSPRSLQILIHNAAVGWGPSTPFSTTKDGLEQVVGVNHFGPFYLNYLLQNDLEASQTRVVVVSSGLHEPRPAEKGGPIPLLLPDFPNDILYQTDSYSYSAARAYRISKLCNLWFAYELQRLFPLLTVQALSPGWIPTTGLARQGGWLGSLFLHYIVDPLRYLGLSFIRTPEDGGTAIVQVATLPVAASQADGGSGGGQYWALPNGCDTIEPKASSEESRDVEKAKQLWEFSMKVCELSSH